MKLFPYQVAGAKFLAGRRFAYLADEMRLGKSAQAIRACDLLDEDHVRVVCPAVARVNWQREFAKFGRAPRALAVSSYELAEDLAPYTGGTLIVDEAHYLKSTDALRAKSIIGVGGLAHSAKRVWFLSGTPTPNNPAELWTILRLAGVTPLSYDAFVARYCKGRNTPYGFRVTGAQNVDELRALMSGFLLRRTKREVRPEMPQVMLSTLVVEPGPVDIEVHFYAQWAFAGEAAVMGQVEAEREKAESAQKFGTLEQIADHVAIYRRYVGLQKVAPVIGLVTAQLEADPTMKIVLFAWHKGVIEGLRQGLTKFGVVTLWGGTPAAKRQANIDAFNTEPRTRVFIGNTLAAGTAIPLTGAHNGLIVEPSWTPGDNAQAAMRMDGPLQTDQITVQFVSVASPLDEAMTATLLQKTRMHDQLFS